MHELALSLALFNCCQCCSPLRQFFLLRLVGDVDLLNNGWPGQVPH